MSTCNINQKYVDIWGGKDKYGCRNDYVPDDNVCGCIDNDNNRRLPENKEG